MTEKIPASDPRHAAALAEFEAECGVRIENVLEYQLWHVADVNGRPQVVIGAGGMRALVRSAGKPVAELDDHGAPLDPELASRTALALCGLVDDPPAAHARVLLLRQQVGAKAFAYVAADLIDTLVQTVIGPAFDLVLAHGGPNLRVALGAVAKGEDPDLAISEGSS